VENPVFLNYGVTLTCAAITDGQFNFYPSGCPSGP
jgi:hypothetical protein